MTSHNVPSCPVVDYGVLRNVLMDGRKILMSGVIVIFNLEIELAMRAELRVEGRAGLGRAGAGQGRAGQGRAGEVTEEWRGERRGKQRDEE